MDHVCAEQDFRWNKKAQLAGRVQVYREVDPVGALDGQVLRPGTAQDLGDQPRSLYALGAEIRPVRTRAPCSTQSAVVKTLGRARPRGWRQEYREYRPRARAGRRQV